MNSHANSIRIPGGPVFHEGLKSWSCCQPSGRGAVTSFDDFLAITGCATGSHSTQESNFAAPVLSETQQQLRSSSSPSSTPFVKEHVNIARVSSIPIPPRPAHHQQGSSKSNEKEASGPFPISQVIEQDPEEGVPDNGTKCKRLACGKVYDNTVERSKEECCFHPGVPIFHEGSKGYSCCKPRVLEFEQFLQLQGCSKNKHLFIGMPKEQETSQEMINLRLDHYQTPTQVIVSIFGKGADKEKSKIDLEHWDLEYDIYLPGGKRGYRKVPLFGPIDPTKSSYKIMSTKTEVILVKADGRSWSSLDYVAGSGNVPRENVTFGVGGRTGTVGAKEVSEAHRVTVYT